MFFFSFLLTSTCGKLYHYFQSLDSFRGFLFHYSFNNGELARLDNFSSSSFLGNGLANTIWRFFLSLLRIFFIFFFSGLILTIMMNGTRKLVAYFIYPPLQCRGYFSHRKERICYFFSVCSRRVYWFFLNSDERIAMKTKNINSALLLLLKLTWSSFLALMH